MTNKIRLHYLVGDVHKGGHDLHRIAKAVNKMLNSTDAFDVLTVCDDADVGDMCFDAYFAADILNEAYYNFVFDKGEVAVNRRGWNSK